jgi:hypothetical protein
MPTVARKVPDIPHSTKSSDLAVPDLPGNSIADLGIAGRHRPQAETIEELPRWRNDELKRKWGAL